jgi:hypothetical protein
VKAIKMLDVAALAALLAMALVGAASAVAEPTALCEVPEEECEEGQLVAHVHETTLAGAKAKLLTSIINVECDVLFLGDVTSENNLAVFLMIEGSFTYTNCGSCTVEEVGGGSIIVVRKVGHEMAQVLGEGEVHVKCSGLSCDYNGVGLEGTAKGPSLSSETNGSVSVQEQSPKKVKGLFCPSSAKLDIVTTPLSKTYIVE